jgi:hypothetical protein
VADLEAITGQFHVPDAALVLVGSHARGDAGTYSDIDLVRFLPDERTAADDGSHLIAGHLVVVSSVTPLSVEQWFTQPEEAVNVVAGLRTARALYDPQSCFAGIKERADAFSWTDALNRRADTCVAVQMVGWAEEVHKGLEGLARNDIGRLLNARFGLSWGLARVMTLHQRILLKGDNTFYEQLGEALGEDSAWMALSRRAFGLISEVKGKPLHENVRAGLALYAMTATMVNPTLSESQAKLIEATVRRIEAVLGEEPGGAA